VADVRTEVPAMGRQHVQLTVCVTVGGQVFAEVPQRPHLGGGELG
jgi:hypothetical protein